MTLISYLIKHLYQTSICFVALLVKFGNMPNWRRRQRGGWRHYARHENKMRRMRSFLQGIFPKQGAGKK